MIIMVVVMRTVMIMRRRRRRRRRGRRMMMMMMMRMMLPVMTTRRARLPGYPATGGLVPSQLAHPSQQRLRALHRRGQRAIWLPSEITCLL
jgi:hypothetical protein